MKHWDETTKCRELRTGGVTTAPKAWDSAWFPVLTPGSGQVSLYLWAMYTRDVRSPLTCCTPAKHTAFPPAFSLLFAINGSVMWHQLFLTLSNMACGPICKKRIWWDVLKAKQMLAGSCSSGECDSSLAQSKELQKWHFEVSPQKMSLKYIKEQKSPEHFPS